MLRSVNALGSSGETRVWMAAVLRLSVPPFFHAERKEPDARAGGDCYTFKSPGSLFRRLPSNNFPFFYFLSIVGLFRAGFMS